MGCDIMCCALALKVEFHWKKCEQKNWKIINTQSFLTLLFMSLLLFNNSKQAAAVAGQKSFCGLQYHGWRVGPEIAIWLKKVSRRTKKLSTLNAFSPYFSCCCCILIIVSRPRKRRGNNRSVGCDIMCGMLALKIAISLKKGNQKNWKIINTQSFLTLLFMSLLLFNNSKQVVAVAGQKSFYGL